MMFWEDFEIGGRRFDPQAFHTDPQAAKRGFFGGVFASGFYTCAVAMRIMVDRYPARAASPPFPWRAEGMFSRRPA